MKKGFLIVGFAIAYLVFAIVPSVFGAETLSKPIVTPPTYWHLESETPYPNAPAEYDPQGAGMVEYLDETDYDFVMIYYERAPAISWSSSSLEAKAIEIFERDHPGKSISDSGTMTIAGVQAGYAKGYDSEYDTYRLETVFTKGPVFFSVYAYYDATSQDEAQVMSLMNSISIQESTVISCSVNTYSVTRGQAVTIFGTISPSCANVPVKVNARAPDGFSNTLTTITTSTGSYSISYVPNKIGSWTFEASWDGNDLYKGAQSQVISLVVEAPLIETLLPYIALTVAVAVTAVAILVFVKKRKKATAPVPQQPAETPVVPQPPESPGGGTVLINRTR